MGGFVAAYRVDLGARANVGYALAASLLLPAVLFAPFALLLVTEHVAADAATVGSGLPAEIAIPVYYGYAVLAV